jgi:hypothetical protein
MLAVALVAGLSGGVFSFLFNLGRNRDGVERATDSLRGAAALMEGIEADAVGVVAGDGDGGAGVVGTETSLTLLTRGVSPPVLGSGLEGVIGDLQGVEYRFDASQGALTARRWDALAGEGGGSPSVLARGVSRIRLRYFDGSGWRASFDSGAAGALPVAIEVAVWFGAVSAEAAAAEAAVATAGDGFDDEFAGGFPDELPPLEEELIDEGGMGEVLSKPDRVRVIVIPDGPVSSWREGA